MSLSSKNYSKLVVVKIGASLFYPDRENFDAGMVRSVASQIKRLKDERIEAVIVSSGAIALGMSVLGLDSRPKELAILQAAAAVGQNELMENYRRIFKEESLKCGQVLLTWEDFSDRSRYLNAKNTIRTLISLGVTPVINENDTVATDEIRFGDNDRLSAMVASLVGAELLLILSDVEGLLDKEGRLVRFVDKITPAVKALACPTDKKTCVGGMITKIEAARVAVDSGIPCIIADGKRKDVIASCSANPGVCGTLFVPSKNNLPARKRWIAFGSRPKGRIIVDCGAQEALMRKKSLLAVGVVGVEGVFNDGDVVSIFDRKNSEIARGRTGVSSKELQKLKGNRYEKEIVHRDDLVVFS